MYGSRAERNARANRAERGERVSNRVESVDVLVVGAGPAGIAAAACAAEQGARTLLLDEGFAPGGQIWRASGKPAIGLAKAWMERLARSGAVVQSSTSVVDAHVNDGTVRMTGSESAGAVSVIAPQIVVATGARERFLPFPGWTLPNVFGIGGAQALLKAGTSFRGKRVVIAGSGPLLLPVAASLRKAGAELVMVAEQAPLRRVAGFAASLWRSPSMLAQAARLRSSFLSTPYASGTWIVRVDGTSRVESVRLTNGHATRDIPCDIVCAAFGLVPNIELARLVGCSIASGFVSVDDRQATTVAGVFCAGEPTGIGGVELSLVEGEIAARAATGAALPAALLARRAALRVYSSRLATAFALRPEVTRLAQPDTIVCRCEDVRLRDLNPSWSSRQAKLYTRAGMGPCQGRICGAALESMMGWTSDSVRLPVQPTQLATILEIDEPN
jgi:NADPH-dependent 2,4-dienoyl-CoA reductase/sulfur reductase-like enzyme